MTKQAKQALKEKAGEKSKGQVGAREVLTQELAQKIARMVEQFPDATIDVTWDNVVRHTKLRFGHEFRRNVLSQKAWGGKKLISDAFHDAKRVQTRQARDAAPKYGNESRARLRLVVARLQSEVLALRDQLAHVRAAQYDEIHSLLDTRTPLNRLIAMRTVSDETGQHNAARQDAHVTVAPIGTTKVAAARREAASAMSKLAGKKSKQDNT